MTKNNDVISMREDVDSVWNDVDGFYTFLSNLRYQMSNNALDNSMAIMCVNLVVSELTVRREEKGL